MLLKQSTAVKIPFFMADSSDSITGKTGLSPTVTLSKDGAAFGAAAGSVTEIGNGWYYLSAVATGSNDTGTLGALLLHATATGADPWDEDHQVCVDIPGGAVASVTAVVSANLTQILGTVLTETSGQIAAAFKQFFNIASPTSTMNVITTVTTAVNLTTFSTANALVVWNALTSTLSTASSIGKLIVDNLNATISSVVSLLPSALVGGRMDASVGAYQTGLIPLQPTAAGRTLDVSATGEAGLDFDNIKDATGAHTLTNITVPTVTTTATATTVTGLSLGAIQSIWDALTSALTTSGSIGKWILDKLDVVLSTRLAALSYTAPDNASITSIKTKTDNLPSAPASTGDVTTVGAAVAAVGATSDAIGVIVTAIEAKTDLLTFNGSNVNAVAVSVTDKTGYSLATAQVPIKKNTALAGFSFPMFDSNGDPAEGLTVTAQVIIDGAAPVDCTNAVVEVSLGVYKINLAAADTNGNALTFVMSAATAKTLIFSAVTQ